MTVIEGKTRIEKRIVSKLGGNPRMFCLFFVKAFAIYYYFLFYHFTANNNFPQLLEKIISTH